MTSKLQPGSVGLVSQSSLSPSHLVIVFVLILKLGLLLRLVSCVLTGSVASFVVAGTVLLSLRRDIVLLIKSCFIPLSLIKSVPPIAGLWSRRHTKA